MNKFIEIKDEKQLKNFLEKVWNFHDGVISKVEYISGSYGSKKGTCPIDDNPKILLRIESCRFNETFVEGIELLFEGLTRFFVSPTKKNYTTNIIEANIVLKNGKLIFVSDIGDDVDKINTEQSSYCYVMAEKLSYKVF